ncbi:hypothetical protein M9458_010296, partial [Cirrhinus mrigala]
SNVSYVTACVFYCRTLSIETSIQFPQDQLMVTKSRYRDVTVTQSTQAEHTQTHSITL